MLSHADLLDARLGECASLWPGQPGEAGAGNCQFALYFTLMRPKWANFFKSNCAALKFNLI